jgi:rhodanese-related sulfurtransferase
MNIVARALILGCVAGLIGAADSVVRPVRIAVKPVGEAEPPGAVQSSDPTAGGTAEASPAGAAAGPAAPAETALGLHITVAQAFELFGQGVPFIDARVKAEFDAGRILGALHNTPADGLKPEVMRLLDPSISVVVYCGGGDCKDSENMVILLQGMGFSRPHIMTDGYPGWVSAGHPIEGAGGSR